MNRTLTIPNAESGEEQRLIFRHVLEVEIQTGQLELSRLDLQRLLQLQESDIAAVLQSVWVEVWVLC